MRDETLRLRPIGTLIDKLHGDGALPGQVYYYSGGYWRVGLTDAWEIFRRVVEQLLEEPAQDEQAKKISGDVLVGRGQLVFREAGKAFLPTRMRRG